MENLKIEYLSVDALTPYERNARKHGDIDVETIVKSIQRFGFDDPIGIWSDKNVIVEGHGRLMAAKKARHEVRSVHPARSSDRGRAQGVCAGAQRFRDDAYCL